MLHSLCIILTTMKSVTDYGDNKFSINIVDVADRLIIPLHQKLVTDAIILPPTSMSHRFIVLPLDKAEAEVKRIDFDIFIFSSNYDYRIFLKYYSMIFQNQSHSGAIISTSSFLSSSWDNLSLKISNFKGERNFLTHSCFVSFGIFRTSFQIVIFQRILNETQRIQLTATKAALNKLLQAILLFLQAKTGH